MIASWTSTGNSSDAVIFLHGVGSTKASWAAQAATTIEAGWRFVAIDLPGFGGTPLPDKPGFGPHIDVLLRVIETEKPSRIVLCGHSMGGMTAQEFHALYPDQVSGLILSATSPAFGKPGGDFQKEFIRNRLEPFDQGMTMPEYARKFSANLLGPNASPKALESIIDDMSTVSVDAYRLGVQTIAGFDQRANLPNISVPALLISGQHDKNAPAKMMAKMAQYIDGADYVELADTGHMAPIENPKEFNQQLSRFLKKLS